MMYITLTMFSILLYFLCWVMLCFLCCAVMCYIFYILLWCAMFSYCSVMCFVFYAVLWCAMLSYCAVMCYVFIWCCDVLCVLCCALLCCAVTYLSGWPRLPAPRMRTRWFWSCTDTAGREVISPVKREQEKPQIPEIMDIFH